MASNTPDVRILVGNLGDASPSGESANLIRTNLEKALAGGIKVKITPDTSSTAKSNGTQHIIKNVQTDSLKAEKAISSMQLQLARFNEYLTTVNPKALTQFSGEINNIRALLGSNVPTDAQKATAAINRLKAGIKSAGYEGGNAITYINAKLKTFATYLVSSAVTMGFVNGVRTMIENVKDLDKALTDLRIVTGSTREETQELLKTYNQMAQRVGSTTSEVASSATSWMRQGYNLEDTDKLIEASMVFSKVGFLDADEAAQALTSTIKGYKLAVEDAMGAIDAFTVLDLDLATSAGEIATALAKTASSAEMAGISLGKAASQIGVVLEVTQASGEEIGNFYKTLMARLSNIKAGRLEDPETGESLDTWGIAA